MSASTKSTYIFPAWRDTGCLDGALPSCLNCPLPACRYEDTDNPPPLDPITLLPILPDAPALPFDLAEYRRLHEEERLSLRDVGARLGVSRSTLIRTLRAVALEEQVS